MARPDCPKCGGTGWKIIEGERELSPAVARVPEVAARHAAAAGASVISIDAKSGASAGRPRVAVLCDCVESERTIRGMNRARIPTRYEHCDFASYALEVYEAYAEAPEHNSSLAQAKLVIEGFARDYPLTSDAGLLLMGPCGTGKTHLAVAAAKEIVARGHEVLFYDYRALLKDIQESYNPTNQATEAGVLEPVLNVEVLLLDDLGASKPSAWALEIIGHVLNTRYNEKRITIATTNFLDTPRSARDTQPTSRQISRTQAPPNLREVDLSSLDVVEMAPYPNDAHSAIRSRVHVSKSESNDQSSEDRDTLTQRIGTRIRSRLYEMCRTVELWAPDFRKEIRKANLPR